VTDVQTRLRALGPDDVKTFVSWLKRDTDALEHSNPLHMEGIARLVKATTLRGMVIEYRLNQAEPWTIGAMGGSVFLVDEVANDLERKPMPWAFPRLLAAEIKQPGSALLPVAQVAQRNRAGGLDLLLHYMQGSWDFTDPIWRAVATRAHDGFIGDHRGYRLRRAFQEGVIRKPDIYETTGYRRLAAFDMAESGAHGAKRKKPAEAKGRALYFADSAYVQSLAPGTSICKMFHHREPKCGFTRTAQAILVAAGRGLTDEAIMAELELSRDTVRRAWRHVFERIDEIVPHVLAHVNEGAGRRRGKEKRRPVLAYLAEHPEELRPYEEPKTGRHATGTRPGKAR